MVPYHASQMLSANITAFLKLLLSNGDIRINREDEIIRETLVAHEGKIVHARIGELIAGSSSQQRSVVA
jgi:NAD(P) transhydrogenase subunit alpha